MILRANWKEHREKIQRDGLRIHPQSEETQKLWTSIRSSYGIEGDESESILRVCAVDDSFFDKTSPSFKQVDSVGFIHLSQSCDIGTASGEVMQYRTMRSYD